MRNHVMLLFPKVLGIALELRMMLSTWSTWSYLGQRYESVFPACILKIAENYGKCAISSDEKKKGQKQQTRDEQMSKAAKFQKQITFNGKFSTTQTPSNGTMPAEPMNITNDKLSTGIHEYADKSYPLLTKYE